jgi:hypothetical protein
MENELQESPLEPASNAESACLSTPESPPPRAETPPSANLYDDLRDGEIRLFQLDINTTGNIVGRLQAVETSSAPSFYALSYVCGSDACSEEITVNNRAFLVRSNLFAALHELRLYFHGKDIARVAIWIDAICIDQDNKEEKPKQIREMHGVFSGAVEVLVWLGAVDDNIRMVLRVFAWLGLYSDFYREVEAFWRHGAEPGYHDLVAEPTLEAMESMARLEHCLKVHHRVSQANLRAIHRILVDMKDLTMKNLAMDALTQTWDQSIVARRAAMDVPLLNDSLFPPDHIFWASLYALLKIKWFGRVWTFQEIRLARRPKVLAQGVCVRWKLVVHNMLFLLDALWHPGTFDARYPDARTRHLPPPEERSESRLKWHQFLISSWPHNEHIPMLYTLVATKHRLSTTAKDHVYGLIALWQREIQDEIVIDYQRETAEVFANSVKIGLKVEFDKKYLHLTIADLWTAFEGPPPALATERLPSWCPDFQHHISPRDGTRREYFLSVAVGDRIKALACYEHTSGFNTISIRGLKLDTISERTEAACPRLSPPAFERVLELLAWLHKIPEDLSSERQVNRSLRRDLQTFFYEYCDSMHSPEFTFDHFSKGLERLLCVLPWQLRDSEALQDVVVRLTLNQLSYQYGRFFFLTDSGRIGYSMRQPCLEGHIILVPRKMPGGPLHMLTADCTQYVGCATVLGLMDDSLLESLEDMETKWETVVLR